MGKAQIISYLGDGKYQVTIKYGGRDRLQARIDAMNARIADLQTRYDAEVDPVKKNILNLQIKSLTKSVNYYTNGMPADPQVEIWCVDLTEDLSGDVGTIEIPGEDQTIVIQPGFEGNAAYSGSRDGILTPAIANSADQAFFNKAILPSRFNMMKKTKTAKQKMMQEM